MLPRDQERIANLNFIYNRNDAKVVQMLRMTRSPYYELVKRFRETGLLQDSIHIYVEEQVSMFLHVVGHN
jgi:transposase